MKKIILCLLTFLAVSCSAEVPKELSLIKETEMIKVHIPAGWKTSSGLGGGLVIENSTGTLVIPINIQQYLGAKINNIDSIPEILNITKKPQKGVNMSIKRLSGLKSIWVESELMGEVVVNVFVPLNDSIISIQTLAKNENMGVSKTDLQLGHMVIENMVIK
jgi:hypothetical protein